MNLVNCFWPAGVPKPAGPYAFAWWLNNATARTRCSVTISEQLNSDNNTFTKKGKNWIGTLYIDGYSSHASCTLPSTTTTTTVLHNVLEWIKNTIEPTIRNNECKTGHRKQQKTNGHHKLYAKKKHVFNFGLKIWTVAAFIIEV